MVQTNEMKGIKTTEEGKVLKPLHVGTLSFHFPSMHLRILEPFIWNPSLQEKTTNALCLISLLCILPSRGACKGAQDANEAKIMLSMTHKGVLTQHNTFWININKTILTFTRQYRTTPDTMVASYFRWSSKIKSSVLKFANNSYIAPMSKIDTNQPSILWYYWALAPFWEETNCT